MRNRESHGKTVRVGKSASVSLNLSFKCLLVSPIYCNLTAVGLYQVPEIFGVTNEVRFYSACFAGRKKGLL